MTRLETEIAVLALLEDTLDQPADAREAYIRAHAPDDAVRERALALLSVAERDALATGGGPRIVHPAPLPAQIGAYRIASKIGEGGMGAVYLGERATGDFDHQVAIKLVRPGALSDALTERFAHERQTLARLSHPGIARLLDGGATADGQPYIVMELVDGVPLDRWLADGPPDVARIRLFLLICDAVGFAHQNLIVHRDITPSNILVEADGRPKLIDFGIARPVTDPADGGPTRNTLAGLSLTPGFAAPERIAGGVATTLSDIFSLGRVLERLFAEPVDRDLRSIIAKAAAAEPDDRYPSADALREDVIAWRDRFPVAARHGGKRYLASRFVARHRVGVTAAVAALLVLIGALALTSWSYFRAEAARGAEAARFAQLRQLARYLVFDLNGRLALTPGNTGARVDLASRAQHYLDLLAASPNPAPDLKLETARGLIALARVQGVPTEPNLGQVDQAKANLAKARELFADAGATPADRATLDVHQAMIALHGEAAQDRAKPLVAAALRTLDAAPVGQRDTAWHEARRLVRRGQLEIADVSNERAAIPAIVAAMAEDRKAWPEALRRTPAAAIDGTIGTYYLALHAASDNQTERALAMHLEAERQFDALIAQTPTPALLSRATWNFQDGFAVASQLSRDSVSVRLIERGRDSVDRLRAIDERDKAALGQSMNIREGLAQSLRDRKRFAEAIAQQQEVVASRRAVAVRDPGGKNGGNLGFSLAIQGLIARDAGDRALACSSWRDAQGVLAALQANNTILGFHASFLPGLRRNIALCDAGAPVSAFKPLRD